MTADHQPLHCNDRLKDLLAGNLSGFETRSHAPNGATPAAVAITVVDGAPGEDGIGLPAAGDGRPRAALVLTRRAYGLNAHAGQWALPGGRVEPGERPEDTALRELEEEVGLCLSADRVLGRLDDFTTRSGFTITPVVVWGGPGVALTANPEEVSSIHRIPVSEFLRSDAPVLEETGPGRAPILFMPVAGSWIAAPTAALIYQFREVAMLGRHTRVAHYDQPAFAWK